MSDNRDWNSYKQAPVRRRELESDSSVIEEWNGE